MDFETEKFLEEVGVGEINQNALYIIVNLESGLLLEDVAPLLMKIESAYRRVFTLSQDKELRKKLCNRLKNMDSLSGVSRAVNSSYRKHTYQNVNKYEDWPSTRNNKLLTETQSIIKEVKTISTPSSVSTPPLEEYSSNIDFFKTKKFAI